MSIKDFSKKIKDFAHFEGISVHTLPDDLFLGVIIVLVAIGAFGLGRISKIEGAKQPIRIINEPAQELEAPVIQAPKSGDLGSGAQSSIPSAESLVASKSGTKYYYSWCSGAQKISAANRIYFSTKEEALARGYTPSTTCKGL